MIEINGRRYPLWSQFVEGKEKWIGGIMQDSGDSMDRNIGFSGAETTIKDIVLRENGKDSAFFEVAGKDFNCGFDVKHGGVVGGKEGWITFSGYGGHSWRIRGRDKT
jgi:hypothetical protein